MKFRVRYTGELKLTEAVIGQSRQVKQTEILELSVETATTFADSISSHIKAGLLVPIDTEAKEAFKTKK